MTTFATSPSAVAVDPVPRWVVWFAWAAGAMDACTGLMLVALPRQAMGLLSIPIPGDDPAMVRFVGAFVFSVGCAYLLPWLEADRLGPRAVRLVASLRFTAWVRACVALVLTTSMLAGEMSWAWAVVAATDGLLALLQFGVTSRRGVLSRVPTGGGKR